jgi:hypothetical protein
MQQQVTAAVPEAAPGLVLVLSSMEHLVAGAGSRHLYSSTNHGSNSSSSSWVVWASRWWVYQVLLQGAVCVLALLGSSPQCTSRTTAVQELLGARAAPKVSCRRWT